MIGGEIFSIEAPGKLPRTHGAMVPLRCQPPGSRKDPAWGLDLARSPIIDPSPSAGRSGVIRLRPVLVLARG